MIEDKNSILISKQKLPRQISREARKRMGIAGAANLAKYHASISSEKADVGSEAEVWATNLVSELGGTLSAKQCALLKAATATYACILLVIRKLHKSRVTDKDKLLASTSFLSGNLDRLLRRLEIAPKARPRTLAEAIAARETQSSEITA